MSQCGRKLPQKINACNTSRGGHLNDVVFHTILSTFKPYNKKEISWKKFFICVLFTFTFESTKRITRYYLNNNYGNDPISS